MHSPQRGKVKQRGIQPTQPIGLGGGPGDLLYGFHFITPFHRPRGYILYI